MATIRHNPDRSEFQVELDDESLSEILAPNDAPAIVKGEDGGIYLASFDGDDILEADTLYQLVPISTLVEEVDEFEDDDEEDAEDGLTADDDEPEPAG